MTDNPTGEGADDYFGDPATYRRLVIAAIRYGAKDMAEDVVQNVYLAFKGQRRRVRFPEAYVQRALLHAVWDLQHQANVERHKAALAAEQASRGNAVGLEAVQVEYAIMINQAVGRLPQRQRECVTLVRLGFSQAEIARLLEIHPGTVQRHLFRANQKLEKQLAELGFAAPRLAPGPLAAQGDDAR